MDKKQRAKAQTERLRALAAAEEIPWQEPNPGHFKVGPFNYYPSTTKFYFDGGRKRGRCSPEVATGLAKRLSGRGRNELRLMDEVESNLDLS
jgi:hypothetical protein